MSSAPTLAVSEFVAVLNQTLEIAYSSVNIVGKLANFRISKNKWVYFDLKDELASVKFFGTVYNLPGPLEDGLMLQVAGSPRLHPQFGFSVNVMSITPVGEGSINRAAKLLEAKLRTEGLFDESRKRLLPYPPQIIGLITSQESAAYHDFIKIISHRWAGIEIVLADTHVQGEPAPAQITAAINFFNQQSKPVDTLVITRGGGSAEDLAAFNSELVTRAVAASRIPTLVAIGHEVDISLAELAADKRASTPSNAAELITPDKAQELTRITQSAQTIAVSLQTLVKNASKNIQDSMQALNNNITQYLTNKMQILSMKSDLLKVLSVENVLNRGFSIVRTSSGRTVKTAAGLNKGDSLNITFSSGSASTKVIGVNKTN